MQTQPKRPSTGLIRTWLYEAVGGLCVVGILIALTFIAVGLHGAVTLP